MTDWTSMTRVECPICGRSFPKSVVNEHANKCLADNEVEDVSEETLPVDGSVAGIKRAKLSVDMESFAVEPKSPGQENPALCISSPSSSRLIDGTCTESSGEPPSKHFRGSQDAKGAWNFMKRSATAKPVIGKRDCGGLSKSGSSVVHNSVSAGNCVKIAENPCPDAPATPSDRDKTLSPMSDVSFAACSTPNKSSGSVSRISDGVPLAEKMRPLSLSDFVGQGHIVGSKKPLKALIESNHVSSMILWGPPGCGKTTLAKIIAQGCRKSPNMRFVTLSATTACLADVKEAIKMAKNERLFQRKTVLFLDEIHRFNKLQQDSFLPHVEDGTIVLVGATTENPSFHVNNALLSRCQVVVLEKLSVDNIGIILRRALQQLGVAIVVSDTECDDKKMGGGYPVAIEQKAIEALSEFCDGDARCALNGLQVALDVKLVATGNDQSAVINASDIKEALQRSHVQYDRNGDEHYNCASALQKSIRGSDANAAIYWMARMLEGGEDPLFIARRLVQCSSEDIGLADPQALPLAVATFHACQLLGRPECEVNLAHCTTYLARAKKSNEAYVALKQACAAIKNHPGAQPGVPLHLRNASTRLGQKMGYGAGYKYNHSGVVDQAYLPTELQHVNFFDQSST